MRVSSLTDLVLKRRKQRNWETSQQVVWIQSTRMIALAFPLLAFPSDRRSVFTTRQGNPCCKLANAHHKERKGHADPGASISKLWAVQKAKQNSVTALSVTRSVNSSVRYVHTTGGDQQASMKTTSQHCFTFSKIWDEIYFSGFGVTLPAFHRGTTCILWINSRTEVSVQPVSLPPTNIKHAVKHRTPPNSLRKGSFLHFPALAKQNSSPSFQELPWWFMFYQTLQQVPEL